jgi:hypothetical protein
MLAPDHLCGRYQGAEDIAATIAQTVGPGAWWLPVRANEAVHWYRCDHVGDRGGAPRQHAVDEPWRGAGTAAQVGDQPDTPLHRTC